MRARFAKTTITNGFPRDVDAFRRVFLSRFPRLFSGGGGARVITRQAKQRLCMYLTFHITVEYVYKCTVHVCLCLYM